ncbi:hypothetical protein DXG01_000537 [Tephrocybe rancida]|nr:hypothetical protein DXG01_000537 [Tephrocybe rancida]
MSVQGASEVTPDLDTINNPVPTGSLIRLSSEDIQALMAALLPSLAVQFQAGAPPPAVSPHHEPRRWCVPSLLSQFPEVEEAVILAVINHTLKPSKLYKLDSKYRDKAERGMLELEGSTLRVKADTTMKDYPTPYSIEASLLVYMCILVAHATSTQVSVVTHATMLYLVSFLKLCSEYEWSAVLNYHMAFFAPCCHEMFSGEYGGWSTIDIKLQANYLNGFCKRVTAASSPTTQLRKPFTDTNRSVDICGLFNCGHCTAANCPHGRLHK